MMVLAGLCGVLTPARGASTEAHRLNEAGVARTSREQYEEAAELFSQALRLSPGDEVIQRNLASVRTVMGHRLLLAGLLEQAEGLYQSALALNPNEVSALMGRGDIHLRRREPRIAAETYRTAVGLDPKNPDAYVRLGEAYYHEGDLSAALSEWERAIALRPGDERVRQRAEAVRREAGVQTTYRSRDSQHFTVVYEGQRREDIGRGLLEILERAYTDVGYELGAYPSYEVQVIFYSEADFRDGTGIPAALVGGGFYHLLDGKIRIALKGLTPGDPWLTAVLYHEYTHALVYAITRGKSPPAWMNEGLAVRMENRRATEFKQEAIRQARAGLMPSLDASPYVQGSAAVEYLVDRHGMSRVRQLLQRLGMGLRFPEAFLEVFQTDLTTFQQDFRNLLVRGY